MILVDNQPILTLPKDDARRDWYETEIAKIQKKKEPIVFKKKSAYRLNPKGIRVEPPLIHVQSFTEFRSDRGTEVWACCNNYKKNASGALEFNPSFWAFKSIHTFDPKKDVDKIFFFTCIYDLRKIGFGIDNPEEDAKIINAAELAELDVKYAIQRRLEDADELRFIAKSWGISFADKLGIEQLRRSLFDTVKQSEQQKVVTHKGYKEFMDEVFNTGSEVSEARGFVNIALTKNILAINKTTRRVTYVRTGDALCIIPLDYANRAADYLADWLLSKNRDLLDTLKMDITGEVPELKMSVADVEKLPDRESSKKLAKELKVKVQPQWDESTIKAEIVKKLQSNP